MILPTVSLEDSGVLKFLFAHFAGKSYLVHYMYHCLVFSQSFTTNKSQNRGFTIGELSETAQEAINAPTKKDVASFSFRGSHQKQNLGCFRRNWAFGDPVTMQYAE